MTSKGSSREGRGESSRSSHSAHGGSKHQNRASAAAEPLFPRVHVSETRNGPKAPPRNKMALYEQLTVPSQHFVQRQSSGSVWPPMNAAYGASQYASFGYMPCYVSPQGLPFHHAVADGMVVPSSLKSQRSMVMDSEVDKELQRVPRVVGEPTNNDIISNGATTSVAPPSFQRSGMVSYVQAPSSQQNHKFNNNTNVNVSSHNNNNNNVSDNNVNTTSNVNRDHKRLRNEDDFTVPTYSFPKDGVAKDTGASNMKQQQHQSAMTKDVNKSSKAPQCTEGMGLSSPTTLASTMVISPRGDHQRVTGGTEQICSSNICESAAGSENKSNDFFQSLHEEQVSGDEDSTASIVDSVGKIAARDVVGAVGEKEFWRTRKTLLRQQRIFATQVFELHRVVKVQHLLAESPQLLVESEQSFEKSCHLKPTQICQEVDSEKQKKIQSSHAVTSLQPSQSNKDQARKEQKEHQQQQEYQQRNQEYHQCEEGEEQEKDHQYMAKVAVPYIPSTSQEMGASQATLLNSNSCSNSSTYPMGAFPTNAWGYAAFPGASVNQWAILPPSACQPYVFQAPPNAAQMLPPPGYSAVYQPMFHAQAASGVGYEMFSMLPAGQRPTMEISPLYWQHQMFPSMQPNVHSSGWYGFPPQVYDSSSQTMLLPPKLPKSANSTVMSPVDHPQIQEQQQHLHQQNVKKFPGSTHNSDMSSLAQSSEYHLQQQQEQSQSQRRGQQNLTQQWMEREHQRRFDGGGGGGGMNCSVPFSYLSPSERQHQEIQAGGHGNRAGGGLNEKHRAMKVVPRAVMATPESAAGILKSIQRERH